MMTLRRINQQPLVIFVLISGLLFLADYVLNASGKTAITISATTRLSILTQEQALKGSELTEEEKVNAIQKYIDKKVLLDEARKLGLEDAPKIQRTMLRDVRKVLTASVPEPTLEQLRIYYDQHVDLYANPVLRDIEFILFRKGQVIPERFLSDLKYDPISARQQVTSSEYYMPLLNQSEQAILARFGKPVSEAIVSVDSGQWTGPVISQHGSVFFRVLETKEGTYKSFNEVERYVRDDWLNERRNLVLDQKIESLLAGYVVRVESLPEG